MDTDFDQIYIHFISIYSYHYSVPRQVQKLNVVKSICESINIEIQLTATSFVKAVGTSGASFSL